MPQDAYHQEKFIRRFVKYFPLPRLILLAGAVAFCHALLFLAFATLSRWAALTVGIMIALTGFSLLLLFNIFRRIQRSSEYVTASMHYLIAMQVRKLEAAEDDCNAGRTWEGICKSCGSRQ